jgi:hypothetical protein
MIKTDPSSSVNMEIKAVNLHIHTTFSDGAFKPRAIVDAAQKNNIDIISITDHDTIEAYNHIPGNCLPTRILPGIEMSSTWKENDVHVLGYGIDKKNRALLDVLTWMKDGRHVRAEKMLDKLSLLGIKIPFELVLSYTGEMQLIVRPHIAQALVASKHCRTKQEAFERYIGNEAPAYVPKPILSTPEVIGIIQDAGGVAVIAHPGKLKSMSYLKEFVAFGLDGIEVCHPDHQDYLVKELEEFCIANHLLQTGGSDFHGELNGNNYLGAFKVSEAVLTDAFTIYSNYRTSQQQIR